MAGSVTCTCNTPATCPGASVAETTVAGDPLMRTETGSKGVGGVGLFGPALTSPSMPGGEVCPSPVTKRVIVLADAAWLYGPFTVPSALSTARPFQMPVEFAVKMPGDDASI
jgi:hypothetical protein